MENPVEKKRFPWGWVAAGCGAIAVLAVAVIAVFMIVALPAIKKTLANQSPLINPFLTPMAGPTIAPTPKGDPTVASTPGFASGTTLGSLPFTFSAVQDPTTLSGQSLMDQMPASLNLNSNSDFMAHKSYTGSATLDPTTSFTIGNAWCAKDPATLQQNLAKMQFLLTINGTNVDLSHYPTLTFTDNSGNACAMTGISITPSGTLSGSYHMVLTQKYLASLDDGITGSPYPAGNVSFDFNISFQVTPSNGKNT